MKLRFFEDPGHGWLEVPIALLRELGIVNCISQYSYYHMEGRKAYLEEDCDAAIFVMEYEKQKGERPEWNTEYQEDCFVRSLGNYPFMKRPLFEAKYDEVGRYFA